MTISFISSFGHFNNKNKLDRLLLLFIFFHCLSLFNWIMLIGMNSSKLIDGTRFLLLFKQIVYLTLKNFFVWKVKTKCSIINIEQGFCLKKAFCRVLVYIKNKVYIEQLLWKPLIVINLRQSLTGNMNWMITLSKLSFPFSGAISMDFLKLPKTDYTCFQSLITNYNSKVVSF